MVRPVVDGSPDVLGIAVEHFLRLQDRRVESTEPGLDLRNDALQEVEGRLLPERLVRNQRELGVHRRKEQPLQEEKTSP